MITEKIYEVVLTTKTQFRIGGKPDPFSGVENPIAAVGNRVVVPGPSLKGAYRAELERHLIDTYPADEDMKPCIPATQLSKDEDQLVKRGLYRYYNKRSDRYAIKGEGCHYPCDPKRRCRKGNHAICPVCYLLGANGLNGFVKVPFLSSEIKADELYSASIDRATGTVKQGTNRPYQILPDGTVFTGKLVITLENSILDWSLGECRPLKDHTKGDVWLEHGNWTQEQVLKELVVDRIGNIDLLGGFKSKGCGVVEIKMKES